MLQALFTDPSVRFPTGAVHPGHQCVFAGVHVSTVFSQWVVQLPVIRLVHHPWSAQPEPAGEQLSINHPVMFYSRCVSHIIYKLTAHLDSLCCCPPSASLLPPQRRSSRSTAVCSAALLLCWRQKQTPAKVKKDLFQFFIMQLSHGVSWFCPLPVLVGC